MKQFIDKLIERLEEEKAKGLYAYDSVANVKGAWGKAIEIINQLAEEHKDDIQTIDVSELLGEQGNDGWIPCSERLPNEADYYLVTKEDDIAYSIDIALWDDYHWSNNGFHKADKVIAWQPLPEYYTPKGE